MSRKHLLLLAGFLALFSNRLRADDTHLVLRLFHLEPTFIEYLDEEERLHSDYVEIGGDKPPATNWEKNWMGFLQKYGLTFPPGSYLRDSRKKLTLFHYNTEQNQKLLGQLLASEDSTAKQVQIDALFVDFSDREIEKLARANSRPLPRSKDILRLWENGKGTLLHALKLITESGVNAQIQAVSEHIYATKFKTPSSSHAAENAASPLPVPDRFETREAGAVFNVTPTVEPDNRTIRVVLAPELTSKPEWHSLSVTGTDAHGKEIQLSVPQPIFHSRNLTTSFVMTDQSTQVFGGMENPTGDRVTYLFLTVTLLDSAGRPLADYAGDTPPERTARDP